MDSYAALGRAVRVADGYHAIGLEPPVAAEMVRRVRRYRPEESFTISLRVRWDERTEDCVVGEQLSQYESAGIQHRRYAAERGDRATWLAGIERLAVQAGLG